MNPFVTIVEERLMFTWTTDRPYRPTNIVKYQTILSNEYNIVTISQTWLDPLTIDTDIQISGYILFRQDRGTHKKGGGVVVYFKDTFKASVITELSAVFDCNFQQLWLKVQCKKLKSFLLCTVYRPPNSPITFLEDIEKTFVDFLLLGM